MELKITRMSAEDVNGAFGVIKAAFEKFVAPGYTREGILEFYKFANPLAMRRRLPESLMLSAKSEDDAIVGVIEVKDLKHISLLFVLPEHHKKGIARQLVKRAETICGAHVSLEVNASPYAVPAYQQLGFQAQIGEQEQNGIRFVPMLKPCAPVPLKPPQDKGK